jgi:hypothetical protein
MIPVSTPVAASASPDGDLLGINTSPTAGSSSHKVYKAQLSRVALSMFDSTAAFLPTDRSSRSGRRFLWAGAAKAHTAGVHERQQRAQQPLDESHDGRRQRSPRRHEPHGRKYWQWHGLHGVRHGCRHGDAAAAGRPDGWQRHADGRARRHRRPRRTGSGVRPVQQHRQHAAGRPRCRADGWPAVEVFPLPECWVSSFAGMLKCGVA